jgi:para-nitrobenzyl esterase
VAGDGRSTRYDGESLATRGIVTVTMSYRLDVFGVSVASELTKESPNHASGNYGLLDQSAALQWVKKNIAAFEGLTQKITGLAREYGGFVTVSAQMASPLRRT